MYSGPTQKRSAQQTHCAERGSVAWRRMALVGGVFRSGSGGDAEPGVHDGAPSEAVSRRSRWTARSTSSSPAGTSMGTPWRQMSSLKKRRSPSPASPATAVGISCPPGGWRRKPSRKLSGRIRGGVLRIGPRRSSPREGGGPRSRTDGRQEPAGSGGAARRRSTSPLRVGRDCRRSRTGSHMHL